MVAEAARAAFAGRLDEAESMTEEALDLNRRHGDDCFQEHTVQRLVLARLRWRPHDADAAQLRGLRGALPAPAGVGGDARDAGVGPRQRRGRAPRRLAVRARRLRRGRALTRLPARRAVPRRRDRRRRRAAPGRAALRAARAATPRRTRRSSSCGRSGGPRRAGSRCSPPPTIARATPSAHFADALRLADEWGAPGWALRTIGDWLATGVPAPDRGALVNRGLLLSRELGLPGVAARIADEAQTITP